MTWNGDLWLGVLSGLIFGGLNFWFLTRIVRGMTASHEDKKWKIPLFFIAKITLLILIIGLILKKGYVSPLPFLAGFTTSLIGGIALILLKRTEKGSLEREH